MYFTMAVIVTALGSRERHCVNVTAELSSVFTRSFFIYLFSNPAFQKMMQYKNVITEAFTSWCNCV